MDCSKNIGDLDCKLPCKRILECGHHCKQRCFEQCGNCKVKVDKIIPQCGHKIKLNCSDAADISNCNQKCVKKLVCGHDCQKLCKEECTDMCNVLVKSTVRSSCEHFTYVPCHRLHSLQGIVKTDEFIMNCNEMCKKPLRCGHLCAGTCSTCFQGRIHVSCQEKCGNILICQHSCKVPCREYCPPCKEKCTYECEHSKCAKKCGEPCISCKENCSWTCKHKKCNKKCGDICDRDPCNEPCNKKLPCGHDCVGLCGETCPPLCRICNAEELTTIFFGDEEEDDARFVLLEECGHVFEFKGLDLWFSSSESSQEISSKQCPKCKSIINKTKRYATACKISYELIKKCKTKLYGLPKENDKKTADLRSKISNLMQESIDFTKVCRAWKKLINHLNIETQEKFRGRRQIPLNAITINKIEAVYSIMITILKFYNKIANNTNEDKSIFITQCELILHSLSKAEYNISEQLSDDVDHELSRLHCITELCKIYNMEMYIRNKQSIKVETANKLCTDAIMCLQKFSHDKSLAAKHQLENLSKIIKAQGVVSQEEKRMIVSAMGLKSGHWYKCPNGHVYCITEWGAMEIAICPECKAGIGGFHHRLLSNNSLATEMDGATRPAWPQ